MKQGYIIFFSIGMLAMLCICAAAREKTADDWYKEGRDLDRNGSYEEAVLAYNKAIELEPNNAMFYTALVPNLNTLAFTTNNQSRRNESLEAIEMGYRPKIVEAMAGSGPFVTTAVENGPEAEETGRRR